MSTFDGSKVINHVALVMAMEAEANPFIEHLHLQLVENTRNVGACKVYQGSVGSGRITLILPGKDATLQVDNVGTTPGMRTAVLLSISILYTACFSIIATAAISTFVAATHFQPDIVVNAGTAGGFVRNGAQIGDAFVGVACAHHDRRIAIPGFTEYGIANYKTLDTPNMIKVMTLFYVQSSFLLFMRSSLVDTWLQDWTCNYFKFSRPLCRR